ncbi:MAG: leucine/isoleucine/valine transporter permease subunit [bacterium ADurb.Bin429]|nr:MAG: leucine/isoleucine/valine transporter permease subunit [bacterium ADurb.Bin429]
MVLAGLVAFLVGMPCLRLHGHYLAMATLGFGMIIYILLMQWPDFTPMPFERLGALLHIPASLVWPTTGGASGLVDIPELAVGPFVFHENIQKFYLTWAFAILALLLCANIVNSRVGRALRAVHGSEAAAATLGVNIAAYKIQVFVLSAVLAALAGSLYAHVVNFVSPPTFNFIRSVDFVVMVVIGGMASIWGAVLGAGTIVLLGNWLQDVGAKYPRFAEFDLIIHSAILILVMIFMPAGIVCTVRDAVLRWLRGRTAAPTQTAPAHVEEVATK